jgi:hypothetical protein
MSKTRIRITPRGVIAAIALPVFFACVTLHAHESRATLTGTVTDPQGSAIPGATVVARQFILARSGCNGRQQIQARFDTVVQEKQ